MAEKAKTGEIYTPNEIVRGMLDLCWYAENSRNILEKHIIDNSCGEGAFLCEIVRRYIAAIRKYKNATDREIVKHLSTYIHGIEINTDAFNNCIELLNKTVEDAGISLLPKWDIRLGNALKNHDYDGKMDFVVGNPPYIRIQDMNLNGSVTETVKDFPFCKNGSTDMYIAFYNLGFNMLNHTGMLCYISPSGWTKGPAGREMRKYINEKRTMVSFIDLGGEKPFEGITVYTGIFRFKNPGGNGSIAYAKYGSNSTIVDYKNVFVGDEMVFGDNVEMNLAETIESYDGEKIVKVKNGLATLCDKIFIYDKMKFSDENQKCGDKIEIPVIKASTGASKFCLFPYNPDGSVMEQDDIKEKFPLAHEYIMENKNKLEARKYDGKWYSLGRKQGISDVWKRKIAVSTVVKDSGGVKIEFVPKGTGVYSGLYILFSDENNQDGSWAKQYTRISNAIKSEDFTTYLKALKKYKNGGYYTFSAKNLEKYLNWKLSVMN